MSKKNQSKPGWGSSLLPMAIMVVAVLIVVALLSGTTREKPPAVVPVDTTTAPESLPLETSPPFEPIDLGDGLRIVGLAPYTGAFVEDGSDEVVGDVLMVILENTSAQALQYARITMTFGSETAAFSVTNLPAGERVVLLEENRMTCPEGMPDSTEIGDVLFLDAFTLYPELFEITGTKGNLTVKNISQETVSGDVYVYYKNSSQDLYYGGITYRSKADGLAPGESKTIIAAHYNPDTSTIVMVTYVP